MKTLIIYDDLAPAVQAKESVERAAQLAGETTRKKVELCRVDLLGEPAIASEVSRNSADSHLIVLSLRQTDSLPDEFMSWLENWAARRQVNEVALAVFKGADREAPSATAIHELSEFAEHHGLSFIFDEFGWHRRELVSSRGNYASVRQT